MSSDFESVPDPPSDIIGRQQVAWRGRLRSMHIAQCRSLLGAIHARLVNVLRLNRLDYIVLILWPHKQQLYHK